MSTIDWQEILEAMVEAQPSLEDKLVEAFDRPLLLEEDITEVVEYALGRFPRGAIDNYVDEVFDIIYEAIEKAIGKIKS